MRVKTDMTMPISQYNRSLLCEQFWTRRLKPALKTPEYISHEGLITGINGMFVGRRREFCEALPVSMLQYAKMTVSQMIAFTDTEFKLLKPITEEITLWRGIGEPRHNKNFDGVPIFEKAYNVKKEDIVVMPEYAFASAEFYYPKFIMRHSTSGEGQRGILYKIEVPKGSKIYKHNHYNFPRCSRFECLGVEDISEKEGNYRLVHLKYIKPEEISPKV